jgi:hypothetical protein
MSVSLPGLPKVGEGELHLEDLYRENGEGLKNAQYKVVDALGKTVEGTLDDSGKAVASGLALGTVKVFFEKDPRDPWADSSYFGKLKQWPEHEPEEIADLGSFSQMENLLPTSAKAALDKSAATANNALSEIRSLPNLPDISGIAGSVLPNLSGADITRAMGLPGWGGGQISLSQNFPSELAGIDPLGKLSQLQEVQTLFPENLLSLASISGDTVFREMPGLAKVAPGMANILKSPTEANRPGALPFPGTPPFVGGSNLSI